jgi:hypothetical protein
MTDAPNILVLTPIRSASRYLPTYFAALERLTWPHERLALGMLEGDSTDSTWSDIQTRLPELHARYRRVGLWQKPFGLHLPASLPRWTPAYQIPRRTVLAKARNHLLFHALANDDDWVLWLDVDVVEYPPNIIERLLAYQKDILHPHCITSYGGPSFDLNAWRDGGRKHMHDLRGGPDLVRLDSVGASMLLIKADIHRDGLIFPPYGYGAEHQLTRHPHPLFGQRRGELESEGLALMAVDMGHQPWGLPNLEIRHTRE